jgi:DNA modification methylase
VTANPGKTEEKKPESIKIARNGLRHKDGRNTKSNSPESGLQTHKIPDSVIRVARHNSTGIEHGHPAIFPVAFAMRMMTPFTDPGDLIYEPFAGSGTVMIAAESTGRFCYGIEIAPQYADISVRRWERFTGRQAVLDRDGRTFATICAERSAKRTVSEPSIAPAQAHGAANLRPMRG